MHSKNGRLNLPFKNLKVGIALYEDINILGPSAGEGKAKPNRISCSYLLRRVNVTLCELYIRILFGKALVY